MKKCAGIFLAVIVGLALVYPAAQADLTFYLVDNFESESFAKWFSFGTVNLDILKNPKLKNRDLVAESCGDFSLKINGAATDWYVGGVGTDLGVDAGQYSRFQIDVFGSKDGGKIKIELYDDDNGNNQIEQDAGWQPLYDDKWTAEIPIMGKGFTRISIPFTAFTLENPGKGDGIWNPNSKNGSSGLIRMQLIFVAAKKEGKVDLAIDNVLLTY